jgi:hypothetical protein
MASRSGVRFGYSTDPETGEPLYAYKPSLTGAPWQFRLGPEALEWRVGARAGRIAYGRIRRLRLSFRPGAMPRRRYLAEIWPAAGPKVTIASASWRGIAEREALDGGYGTFVSDLHRRIAAAGSNASFERGAPTLLYWPTLVLSAAAAMAMGGLTIEALRTGVLAGALFVAAFLALFLWQMSDFFRRNRPGTYRPDALPAGVLPPLQRLTTSTEQVA